MPTKAQTIIFSEDFGNMGDPEYNNATNGTSDEGYNWNTNCPSCVDAGDFYQTASGVLRGQDTNGPATFTANGIDGTGCLLVVFQFDYNSVGYQGSGNLECTDECPGVGMGDCSGNIDDAISDPDCFNCWDFLAWEISSGAVSDNNVVLGLDCNVPDNGSAVSNPLCVQQPGADPSNLTLTITMSMWATTEWMEVDNITVLCYTEQQANDAGIAIPSGCLPSCEITLDNIDVTDASCSNVADGGIEIDATGTGLSGTLEYSIDGGSSFQSSGVFNGLTEGSYDIIVQDSDDPACSVSQTVTVSASPTPTASIPQDLAICFSLSPLTGEILNLNEVIDEITDYDSGLTVNWWFDAAGNNPIDPTDPGDLTTLFFTMPSRIYASVSDGICESNTIPIDINLSEYPDAINASLSACNNGNGTANFDLTTVESTILDEQAGHVTFYEDIALSEEIAFPSNFISGEGFVYAIIDNEGCLSNVATVSLNVISFSPSDFSLSFSPDQGCGPTLVEITLNTPSSPPGDFIFEISYGPSDFSFVDYTLLEGEDGDNAFSITIEESYILKFLTSLPPNPMAALLILFSL
ncbi:MAG: hypothetical protein R2795_01880 [Saprospiraceae bacterium]